MNEPDHPQRGTRGEACPWCLQRGVWSSLGPERIYCPPPGHTVRRLGDEFDGITVDTCPYETRPD